jgi:hypothetical protein
MRFFDELLHPAKKCARIGHKYTIEITYWYASTWKAEELLKDKYFSYRSVAEKLKKTQSKCLRCGKVIRTKWDHVHSYQSFSYSGHEFEETGLIEAE